MLPTALASFEVTGLDLSPTEISPDESVTIKATVANTGDISGSYDVTLKVNGEVISTEKLNLAGHTSKEVSFTLTPDKTGIYTIDVNGTPATLTVSEAATETPETPAPTQAPEATPTEPVETAPAPTEIKPTPTGTPQAPATLTPVAPQIPVTNEPTKGISSWLIFLAVALAGAFIIGGVYLGTRVRK